MVDRQDRQTGRDRHDVMGREGTDATVRNARRGANQSHGVRSRAKRSRYQAGIKGAQGAASAPTLHTVHKGRNKGTNGLAKDFGGDVVWRAADGLLALVGVLNARRQPKVTQLYLQTGSQTDRQTGRRGV